MVFAWQLTQTLHLRRYHRQKVAEKRAEEHTAQPEGGQQEMTAGQRDAREGVPFTTAAAVEADKESGLAGRLLGTTPDVTQVSVTSRAGRGNEGPCGIST
jgi:hypothetical protein